MVEGDRRGTGGGRLALRCLVQYFIGLALATVGLELGFLRVRVRPYPPRPARALSAVVHPSDRAGLSNANGQGALRAPVRRCATRTGPCATRTRALRAHYLRALSQPTRDS